MAAATAWLFGDVLMGLVIQWVTSPDASYGLILAAVGGVLLWQQRASLAAATPAGRDTLIGALILAAGLAMYVASQLAADVFTARASFVLVVGGLLWCLYGAAVARRAATPLFFVLLAIPLPELLVTTLTGSLQAVATGGAELLLTSSGIPVYRDGNILELPTSTLQVIEACSGMRSVVSLAAVGLLVAWVSDGDWRRRLGLVLMTTPIAVLANIVRLAATGAATERWGEVAARDPWHSLAGWLTFVMSLLLLWAAHRALFAAAVTSRPPLAAVRV